ncbi:hypothetical protein PABG_03553 [Paracoccidioides brasiliensis Pb03]|nr:hypothetical protein PABG_03553 [Paracoccidioides brasiliensis Pb03]
MSQTQKGGKNDNVDSGLWNLDSGLWQEWATGDPFLFEELRVVMVAKPVKWLLAYLIREGLGKADSTRWTASREDFAGKLCIDSIVHPITTIKIAGMMIWPPRIDRMKYILCYDLCESLEYREVESVAEIIKTASIDTRKLLTGEQKAPSPYFHGFFRGNAVANSYVKSPLSISQATDMLDLRLLLPPLSRIPTTPQNRSRGADHADDMFGLQPQVKSCGGLESTRREFRS